MLDSSLPNLLARHVNLLMLCLCYYLRHITHYSLPITYHLPAFGPHGIRVSRPSGRKFTTSTTLSRGKNCCQFSDQTTCGYVIQLSLYNYLSRVSVMFISSFTYPLFTSIVNLLYVICNNLPHSSRLLL